MRSGSAHGKSVIRDVTICTYQLIGCYKFTVSIAKQQTVLRLFCAWEYMHCNTKILICSWDKTLKTKHQHPIPQYRNALPNPITPTPKHKNQWHFIRWRSVRGIMTGYGSCTYMVMMGCTHRIRFLLLENNIQRRIKTPWLSWGHTCTGAFLQVCTDLIFLWWKKFIEINLKR